MNLEQFKEMMEDDYGITEDNFPAFNRVLTRCLRKISEDYPACETSYITTVKNQTQYTINHDDIMKIKQVHHRQPVCDDVFNDPDIPKQGKRNYSITERFTDLYEDELDDNLNPVGAEIIDVNKFNLIPTPESSYKVYYEYLRFRSFDEIPLIFEDDLIDLFFHFKSDPIYQTKKTENAGNVFAFDRRGNTVETDTSANDLVKNRKDQLKTITDEIKRKALSLG
jgi:hypothetical protein